MKKSLIQDQNIVSNVCIFEGIIYKKILLTYIHEWNLDLLDYGTIYIY